MSKTTIKTNNKIDRNEERRYVGLFTKHLFEILPLYNVSFSGKRNQVISYCSDYLKHLGREVTIDDWFNLVSNSEGNRAMVAHTDSVAGNIDFDINRRNREDGSIKGYFDYPYQKIRYSDVSKLIVNETAIRPMGGDDKVGVAACLAMAEIRPDMNIWLVADEEVGLIGSSHVVPGKTVEIAVQLDRRGTLDLVNSIGGTIAEKETVDAAKDVILGSRTVTNGGPTDVKNLVQRGLADCAFNMSCGYFSPHSEYEYIHLEYAVIAAIDGYRILTRVPSAACKKVSRVVQDIGYRDRHRTEDFWNNDYVPTKRSVTHNTTFKSGFRPSVYPDTKKHKDVPLEALRECFSGFYNSFDKAFEGSMDIAAYKLLRQLDVAFSFRGHRVNITPLAVYDKSCTSEINRDGVMAPVIGPGNYPIEEQQLLGIGDSILCEINTQYRCDWCRQECYQDRCVCFKSKEIIDSMTIPGIVCVECWKRYNYAILAYLGG